MVRSQEFAPAKVKVPAPTLVRLPGPKKLSEKVASALLPPVVSVAEPRSTLPSPASRLIVWSKPLRSSVV